MFAKIPFYSEGWGVSGWLGPRAATRSPAREEGADNLGEISESAMIFWGGAVLVGLGYIGMVLRDIRAILNQRR
jgi:hypothetical protein